MSKHTKGPWKNFSQGRDKEIICCQDERVLGMLLVATVETLENHNGDEFIKEEAMHANAALIAAAPEMLEALELLLKKYNYVHEVHFGVLSPRDDSFVTYIENILKKARGDK